LRRLRPLEENVTASTGRTAETSAKIVELIRELVPAMHLIIALANAPDPFSTSFFKEMQLGWRNNWNGDRSIAIQNPEELDTAFSVMVRERPGAIVVLADGLFQRSGRHVQRSLLGTILFSSADRQERVG
jgi:hypothetical protein